MTTPFDFAFPKAAFGRSSGWGEKRQAAQTIAHPPIVSRREVRLAERWRGMRIALDASGVPNLDQATPTRLLIKAADGEAGRPALSSGASSALLREADGQVTRIKRCGFARNGVGARVGYIGRIGMMGLGEALHEGRMLATFHAQGLCAACRPTAIEIAADPDAPFFKEQACAAVRVAVTSDVRADEWMLIILNRELEQGGVEPPFFVVQGEERVLLRQFGIANAVLQERRSGERMAILGRGLGGLMRAVHDAGYVRGRGSAWFGNDVVGPDLRLSAVDADGGAADASTSLAVMKRVEVADYAAGFADYFSWGQSDWIAEYATILCEMFWEGYRTAAPPNVIGSLEAKPRLKAG